MTLLTLTMLEVSIDDKLTIHKGFKHVKIQEFGDNFGNHHEKCIQMSTNMPGIGLDICEISRILRDKTILYGW